MYKTRETLVKELEEARAERDAAMAHAKDADRRAGELRTALDKAEQNQKLYDNCFEAATQLKTIQQAFIDAGFDKEQALTIILRMLPSGDQTPNVGPLLGMIL